MMETYSEEELKRIILWIGNAPDFWEEYDRLIERPTTRQSEIIDEMRVDLTLMRAQERVNELRWDNRIHNIEIGNYYGVGHWMMLTYNQEVSREQYINDKLRARRQCSPQNNYKEYLFRTLRLRNQSSIRNVYVKLLLEHKISLEDFANLVQARDVDVDLVSACGGDTARTESNYFI